MFAYAIAIVASACIMGLALGGALSPTVAAFARMLH